MSQPDDKPTTFRDVLPKPRCPTCGDGTIAATMHDAFVSHIDGPPIFVKGAVPDAYLLPGSHLAGRRKDRCVPPGQRPKDLTIAFMLGSRDATTGKVRGAVIVDAYPCVRGTITGVMS